MKVTPITKESFFKKFNVKEVDLVKEGLFTKEDLLDIRKEKGGAGISSLLGKAISYLSFSVQHPRFFIEFIVPAVKKGLFGEVEPERKKDLKELQPIKNCILKASIATAFKPRRLLEIGTYLGWGAASFKKAIPYCEVYTMNIKQGKTSENPIEKRKIGSFYRRKKLKVKQIWADSTEYDFQGLPEMDVVYIDGSHKYEDVRKDIANSLKVARKSIIVDDYVPYWVQEKTKSIYGPWNEGVIKALDSSLAKIPSQIKHAFWIIGTPYCVLIK